MPSQRGHGFDAGRLEPLHLAAGNIGDLEQAVLAGEDGVAMVGPSAQRTISAGDRPRRSEEHTSELQSLMRISYAVFCLKTKKQKSPQQQLSTHLETTTHMTQISTTHNNTTSTAQA